MTSRAEMTQSALMADLQSIVGTENARLPEEPSTPRPYDPAFMIDGLMPDVIVSPGTYEEVAAVMRYANKTGSAVIPLGRGEYKGAGNFPRRYDIALSVARLNRIIEYEPADLTVTCQAGISLGDLSQPLRESGQMTPFGSSLPGGPSIGKLLATNDFGNLQYGSPRDFTLGMRVVTADGRITRAGGKVVKNVAGYDLCKLYIGSMGTLAVVVEASLKVAPLPHREDEVRLEAGSLEDACRFATELQRRGVCLWRARIRRPTFRSEQDETTVRIPILVVGLAGTLAGVERSLFEIERLAQDSHMRPVREDHEPPDEIDDWPSQGDVVKCQMSVLPSLIPALVAALDETAPETWINVQPLSGSATAAFRMANAEAVVTSLRRASGKLGGSLTVIDCPPALKRKIDVFGDPPPAFDLMRRVKQQFDPNGIHSPGRFEGKL